MKKMKSVLAATGIFLLTKMKFLIPLAKLLKLPTLITMFLSFWAYAVFYGWKFAAAFIYILLIHEMGHLVAAKIKKIPTSPAIFIPFVGAVIGIDSKKVPDAKTEAFIAYGGPLFGLLSILPFFPLYLSDGNPLWGMVIGLGAMINLFNLLPMSPMDGGRIVTVLSTKLWFVGLVAIGSCAVYFESPLTFLMFLFGFFTWWSRIREPYKIKKAESELAIIELELKKNEALSIALSSLSETEEPREIEEVMNAIYSTYQPSSLSETDDKKLFIPFVHDNKKLIKETNQLQTSYTDASLRLFDAPSLQEFEEMRSLAEMKMKERTEELKKEITRFHVYYKTTWKEKISTFFLYLLLAALLTWAMQYGINIMEGHPEILK